MSLIDLEKIKHMLDVIHSSDDDKLQVLLDGAESEAQFFIGRNLSELKADPAAELPSNVIVAVSLMVQAGYGAQPDDAQKLRQAAEARLKYYRPDWE